jgi:dihydrofolate synthase / folylpolyglutamate synthase
VSQPITLVFGAMKDKQIAEIAEILFPLAENLILTQPNNSRSATVEELEEIALKIIDKSKVFVVPNVKDAIDSARQIAETYPATKGSLICVTGSLYLVGEAQKYLSVA